MIMDISGRFSPGKGREIDAVFACSPHKGGSTDRAAEVVFSAWSRAGYSPRMFYLREYHICGCQGCGHCSSGEGCVLQGQDECVSLFEALRISRHLCFLAPIYFYHLPAQFKAFIDRSQSVYMDASGYWSGAGEGKPRTRTVLLAGRSQGEKLFVGSELTLEYFLRSFGRKGDIMGLRGIEKPGDLGEAGGKIVSGIEEFVLGKGS